ncbi:MAG: flagellar export protein FliJ [Desulfobacteraceae bacterium]|nr:flagellar export protein FliJ [Desulfobacteraceae bacterium]MCF8094270.1 flagellar export protein FliJ [Desulfobacteraceae bacterium]
MKPFKLQSLLDYRKRLADKAYETLQLCMEEREAIAEANEAEKIDIHRLRTELEEAKTGNFRVQEIMLYEQCIHAKKRRMQDLKYQLTRADTKVREKRQELVKARQNKRVLEILKEKREESERSKQERQEKMFMDEIAVFGFGGGR